MNLLWKYKRVTTANIAQRGDMFSFSIPSPFQHLQGWIKTRSKNPADAILAYRCQQAKKNDCFNNRINIINFKLNLEIWKS